MYLPTKEVCDKIIHSNESFMKKEDIIEGISVSQFSYILASYENFKFPLGKEQDAEAFELRGISFVENGSEWERFLFIPKFFNLNETIGSMYDDVKDKEIECIMDKRDGSAITFIRLPSGKFVAKSKYSFISDQAKASNAILQDSPDLLRFLEYTYNNNIQPLFEYTAPNNRIVLLYEKESLVVLGLRNKENGNFLTQEEMTNICSKFSIPYVDFETGKTLDDLVEESKEVKNKEGWVVRFKDGSQIKIKTTWYRDLHGLVTDDLSANVLLRKVIDGEVDDLLSFIPPDFTEVRAYISQTSSKLQKYINHQTRELYKIISQLKEECPGRKEYALSVKKTIDPDFQSIAFILFNEENLDEEMIEKRVANILLKKYNKKEKAEKFIAESL